MSEETAASTQQMLRETYPAMDWTVTYHLHYTNEPDGDLGECYEITASMDFKHEHITQRSIAPKRLILLMPKVAGFMQAAVCQRVCEMGLATE